MSKVNFETNLAAFPLEPSYCGKLTEIVTLAFHSVVSAGALASVLRSFLVFAVGIRDCRSVRNFVNRGLKFCCSN